MCKVGGPRCSDKRPGGREKVKKRIAKLKDKLHTKEMTVDESDTMRTHISNNQEFLNEGDSETSNISDNIKDIAEPDAGGTFSLDGKTPTVGFCASPYPEYSKVFNSADEVTVASLTSYVADIRKQAPDLMNEDETYLGLWNDPESGKIYVDVSKRYKTAQEARSACENHDQIAFFDLCNLESVDVDRNATSGQN